MTKNTIGKTLGTYGSQWRDAVARRIMQQGISPNILTYTGVVINLFGGVLIGLGGVVQHNINWVHIIAGVVIWLANVFDMLDGAVARISGEVTKFGAFSDSVMDRYSDMALFAGAITYFALRCDLPFIIVASLALVGSLMTSYTRARAESLLPGKYNAGYMERPERIVILFVTCLFNRLYMGMIFIAIFGNLATLHRIWDTRQTAFNLEHPQEARQGYGSPDAPWILRFFRNIIFWEYPRQTWQHDAMGAFLFTLTILSFFFLPGR